MPCLTRPLTLLGLLALLLPAALPAFDWIEVDPRDLTRTECPSDPRADAEIIFHRMIEDQVGPRGQDMRRPGAAHFNYEGLRYTEYHHLVKIYKDSALDTWRRKRIRYRDHRSISGLRARVIKQDGSVVVLDPSDVYQETAEKRKEGNYYTTSFSFPQVEVGDLIEYRYRLEWEPGWYTGGAVVTLQQPWPIRRLEIRFRPALPNLSGNAGYKWVTRNTNIGLVEGKQGFFELEAKNLEPYPDEPNQLPEQLGQAWFMFYIAETPKTGEAYWEHAAKEFYREASSLAKEDRAIKEKARELVAGRRSSEEKLKAIYDFCRSEIRNAGYGAADSVSANEKEKLEDDLKAGKILDLGYGSPDNINVLFCALAQSAGFDAQLAAVADKSEGGFFAELEKRDAVLPDILVAVRGGKEWTFYDPGARYLDFGKLYWTNAGATALVADKRRLELVKTQTSEAADNRSVDQGRFKLHADGSLTGTVVSEATGQKNFNLKAWLDHQSEAERSESMKERLQKNWPNGTIENVRFENVEDPFQPIKLTYDLRLPNYAEVLGERLIIKPNVFNKHAEPKFNAQERVTPIFFEFQRQEEVRAEIELPAGFELEAPSAPRPVEVKNLATYQPALGFGKDRSTLIYRCQIDFQGQMHSSAAYPAIKAYFDAAHQQDQHALTLKPVDAVSMVTYGPSSGRR